MWSGLRERCQGKREDSCASVKQARIAQILTASERVGSSHSLINGTDSSGGRNR
jgi:hypothetical protein